MSQPRSSRAAAAPDLDVAYLAGAAEAAIEALASDGLTVPTYVLAVLVAVAEHGGQA